MTLRAAPFGGLVGIALLFGLGCAADRDHSVLFIVVDTLRADHLSFYGYPRKTSPTFDALARDSVVFTDAMSQAPITLPSILQIMTGRMLVQKSIPESTPTLAELFRRSGYTTMAVVDNPVIELRETHLERGFDDYFVNSVLDERLVHQHWKTKTPADVITRRAIRWLEARDRERPFFVWLHYFDPHDPYFPPYTHDFPFVQGGGSTWTGDIRRNPIYRKPPKGAPPHVVAPADRQRLIDLYDAEIAYFDRSLADLVAYLKDAGLYDDMILVLTSDHGEAFGERDEWAHGRSLYQNQLHVPLLIKLPGGEHRRVDSPVQLVDLAPTLCAVVDVECAAHGPVRNILQESYDDAFALWKTQLVVRDGSWKLLFDTSDQTSLLFDLSSDPNETRDLSRARPERLAQILAKKNAWLRQQPSFETIIQQSIEQVEQLEALGYLEPASP